MLAWLTGHPTVRYVVLSSPFSQYLADGATLVTREGRRPADPALVQGYFEATLARLAALGMRPVVFAPPPVDGKISAVV